jgi:hypothetical protein
MVVWVTRPPLPVIPPIIGWNTHDKAALWAQYPSQFSQRVVRRQDVLECMIRDGDIDDVVLYGLQRLVDGQSSPLCLGACSRVDFNPDPMGGVQRQEQGPASTTEVKHRVTPRYELSELVAIDRTLDRTVALDGLRVLLPELALVMRRDSQTLRAWGPVRRPSCHVPCVTTRGVGKRLATRGVDRLTINARMRGA